MISRRELFAMLGRAAAAAAIVPFVPISNAAAPAVNGEIVDLFPVTLRVPEGLWKIEQRGYVRGVIMKWGDDVIFDESTYLRVQQ